MYNNTFFNSAVRHFSRCNQVNVPKVLINEMGFSGNLYACRVGENHLVINNKICKKCALNHKVTISNAGHMQNGKKYTYKEYRIKRYDDVFSPNVNDVVMVAQPDGIHVIGIIKD